MTPLRRAQLLASVGALLPALAVGLIALLAGPIVAVVLFVAVGAGVGAWLWWGVERQVLASLGGRPADLQRDARLLNLIDGLCITAGVRQPNVVVTEDAGLNLLVAGHSPERATLAVTTGLVESLSRIELEGVLADGLVQIRRGDIVPATVVVAFFGIGARFAGGNGDRAGEIDRAGVALTRYPPALVSAFETMQRHGTAVAGVRSSMAHLWLADPTTDPASAGRAAGGDSRRPALAARVSALREL